MLAVSSDCVSDRLADTRTNGRTRTTSRSPTRFMVVTRIIWRAPLASPAGGRRSLLRVPPGRSLPLIEPRMMFSMRSGRVAKCVSPSSEANTAPPISAAPLRPVRIVPENHCARDAAAIDRIAAAAVDRKWRLVAEIDGLVEPRSVLSAPPSVVQIAVPCTRGYTPSDRDAQ